MSLYSIPLLEHPGNYLIHMILQLLPQNIVIKLKIYMWLQYVLGKETLSSINFSSHLPDTH